MRISVKVGRSRRVLALAATVLLSGSALAAVTLPALAAGAAAPQPGVAARPALTSPVAVVDPGLTTEPLEVPIDLPLTATDTDAAGLPLTWSGSLDLTDLGLTVAAVNANGTEAAITGTVPAIDAGTTFDVTVTATDGDLNTGSAEFTLALANTVAVANPGDQTSALGAAITPLPIGVADNDTAATFTYTAAALPNGLAIAPATGVISGTPTALGTFNNITVTATDDTGATATSTPFTWTINAADKIDVTAPASKDVWQGVAVNVPLTATDSAVGQDLTWTATTLPAGLTINATNGAITGKPTKTGVFTSHVKAADGTGASDTVTIKWTVAVPVVIPNDGTQTTTVGSWLTNIPFTYKDYMAGDKPTFSATGLPSGMGFETDPLLIYGWPNNAGTYHVTIHEHGSLGSTDTMTFKLVVKSAPDSGGTNPDTGGAGQLHLAFAGKCLQDPGNRTANGTHVELEPCVSGATEHWTVAADNTIRANGHCLMITGSGSSSGKQLVLSSCNGSTRQRWAPGTDGELANPASGLCAIDPGSSKRNGTVPTTGTCRAQSNEEWTLPAQTVLTALGGSCLDDSNSSGVNGNKIDMFWCKYSGSKWTFERDGTIRMFGNKCVTVVSGKAKIWSCGSHSGQKWTVVRTSAMGSELAQGGVCLAIPSMTSANGKALEPNGTQLVTAKCSSSTPRDLWHIE